jgi:uncharacterized protein YegP (UPF0339 family)|tara:strand:+ start:458 stop:691 length:234 start_codon:yes stop_codon:yes gene_type:complete
MENQAKHILLYANSMIILQSLKHKLDAANISSIIKSNTESARLAGFIVGDNDNQLFIYETDAISAKKILEDFLSKKD